MVEPPAGRQYAAAVKGGGDARPRPHQRKPEDEAALRRGFAENFCVRVNFPAPLEKAAVIAAVVRATGCKQVGVRVARNKDFANVVVESDAQVRLLCEEGLQVGNVRCSVNGYADTLTTPVRLVDVPFAVTAAGARLKLEESLGTGAQVVSMERETRPLTKEEGGDGTGEYCEVLPNFRGLIKGPAAAIPRSLTFMGYTVFVARHHACLACGKPGHYSRHCPTAAAARPSAVAQPATPVPPTTPPPPAPSAPATVPSPSGSLDWAAEMDRSEEPRSATPSDGQPAPETPSATASTPVAPGPMVAAAAVGDSMEAGEQAGIVETGPAIESDATVASADEEAMEEDVETAILAAEEMAPVMEQLLAETMELDRSHHAASPEPSQPMAVDGESVAHLGASIHAPPSRLPRPSVQQTVEQAGQAGGDDIPPGVVTRSRARKMANAPDARQTDTPTSMKERRKEAAKEKAHSTAKMREIGSSEQKVRAARR